MLDGTAPAFPGPRRMSSSLVFFHGGLGHRLSSHVATTMPVSEQGVNIIGPTDFTDAASASYACQPRQGCCNSTLRPILIYGTGADALSTHCAERPESTVEMAWLTHVVPFLEQNKGVVQKFCKSCD